MERLIVSAWQNVLHVFVSMDETQANPKKLVSFFSFRCFSHWSIIMRHFSMGKVLKITKFLLSLRGGGGGGETPGIYNWDSKRWHLTFGWILTGLLLHRCLESGRFRLLEKRPVYQHRNLVFAFIDCAIIRVPRKNRLSPSTFIINEDSFWTCTSPDID